MAKKKKAPNYYTKTKDVYETHGYQIKKTEYWNGFARKRKDLLGFIDALAWKSVEWVGIQETSVSNMRAREKKILSCPYAWDWLLNPSHRIHVVGWKKYDKPVDRKYWRPTVKEITLEDFVDGRPIEAEDG